MIHVSRQRAFEESRVGRLKGWASTVSQAGERIVEAFAPNQESLNFADIASVFLTPKEAFITACKDICSDEKRGGTSVVSETSQGTARWGSESRTPPSQHPAAYSSALRSWFTLTGGKEAPRDTVLQQPEVRAAFRATCLAQSIPRFTSATGTTPFAGTRTWSLSP